MNISKNFQNAWNLMLRNRVLWIFGVLLTLTTVSIGSVWWLPENDEIQDSTLLHWEISAKDQVWIKENFGLDLPLHYNLELEDLKVRLDDPMLSAQERARLLNVAKIVLAGVVILITVTLVLRYTSEAALIRLVNDQQYNNVRHSVGKGFSLGFSGAGLKLFVIDVIIFSLLIILTSVIFLPALLPLFLAITGSPTGISLGILLMISLTLVCCAALVVLWISGLVILKLAYRASCLEGLGVFAAIWRGIYMLRTQLRDVGLTAVLLTGMEMVYPILIVPVALLLAAAGLVVGGLVALILGALLTLMVAKAIAWTAAIIVGVVLLALVVIVPVVLLNGLREVFISSTWTLTFKEASRRKSTEGAPLPQSALPQAGSA